SEKIIHLRKERGWSQEQLAIKLDVSRQAVYKWEADINQPDLEKLKRISAIFNISYDALMNDDFDLSSNQSVVEVEKKEIPEVEIIENTIPLDANGAKSVHNEVAVQINYGKDNSVGGVSKKLIASLCVLAAIIVICLCTLSYVIFGIVLQKDSYLVKFDTQGGNNLTDLVIKEGSKIEGISSPTKNGYTFEGWYIGDKKWDLDLDKIKGNTTLIAKWTPNENTITYIDYETGKKYEGKAKTDETVVLSANTFTKEGSIFVGWALSPNGESVYSNCDSVKMGAENMTLYAVWSSDIYNLILNVGKGKIEGEYKTVFSPSEAVILPTPVLEFYTFDGWYDSNNNRVEIISKGTAKDVALTAKYTPIQYSISYVLNGGKNDISNPNTYNAENVVSFISPERQDYSFNGWYLDEALTVPIYQTTLGKGGNITLYASWDLSIFSFELVSGGYSVIGYSGSSEIVDIPKEYNGVKIVKIGERAFFENEFITKINIPSTVTSIEVTAFEGCAMLTEINVDINNSKYLSENGILYNKQKTVIHKYPMGKENTVYIAPNSLDVVGKYAFNYAIYLEEVYLPNDINGIDGVGKISAYAFEGCISLIKIELGYLANYIEACAFQNCVSLAELDFKAPEVYGIEKSAFENCLSLSSVTFNGKVNAINDRAFHGCFSLESIDLTGIASLGSYVFQNTGLTDVFLPITLKAMGSAVFWGCEDITVRCEVSSRPTGWAIDWHTGVMNVIWGDTDNGATDEEPKPKFTYEANATGVSIIYVEGKGVINLPSYDNNGNKITRIEAGAFAGQTEITEVIIPVSVTYIDPEAFSECIGLEKITYLGAYTEYRSENGVLYGDYGKSIVKYPEGKKDLEFTVPYNIDIIRKYAFKNNTYLKEITLPSDVEGDNYVGKIELGGFEGCSSLEYVYGCAVGYFDKEAFKDCISLKELTFHNDISFIMNQVFLNCVSLESVTFKKNVGIINWQSFGYCESLKQIDFEGTLDTLGWGCFEFCSSLESIVIPEGTTVIGGESFKDCAKLKTVVISSTVTKIEEGAFLGAGLEKIFIPATVVTIEQHAFCTVGAVEIYCEALSKPEGWDVNWNATEIGEETDYHNVIWGQTKSDA
ncbi:MAG: leucine-rich repeat protein, partial [Clostridia bacterium]|nr:leucine-rich repeat protein [Clostridia bacterium]